jgi:hypothetical protein
MPLIFWINLVTIVKVLFPHLFILRKYEKRSFGGENFQAFEFFETIWLIVSFVGFFYGYKIMHGFPGAFALTAIVLASITIPIALFSGLTGIYPERSRIGYFYYVDYKNPAKRLLAEGKYPELKMTGWLQLLFLVVIILVSVLTII